jgi:hypothetical protein
VTLELKDADSFCRVAERCNRKSLQWRAGRTCL